MNDNLMENHADHREEGSRSAEQQLYPMTPEEMDALWEDSEYTWDESDDDWGEDQLAGTESRGNDSFTLKYMDEEKTVTREEVVTLAQKGMDYDRVRRRLEEAGSTLKEYEDLRNSLGLRGEQLRWMDELAREQGLSLDTILEDAHVELLYGKTGQNREECRSAARRQQEEWQQRQSELRRRGEDIDAFFRAYPDQARDPQQIPPGVWSRVRQGERLLDAYRAYEVEELRRELARQKAELQKQQDRRRTTGSQQSSGSKWVDPIDAIWYNGE